MLSFLPGPVLNVGLRGLTLVSKFLLIFVLAKLLTPAEVALYGLLTATIAYALMALGLDFYTYATRDLIAADRSRWAGILRDQGVVYLVAYALLLPLFLLLFSQGLLPWSMALWFFPLLAVEHLAQELNRLLIATSEPLWASVVLFLRSGLWAVLIAACMWLIPESRNLGTVFGAWLLSATMACLLALWPLRRIDRQSLRTSINWAWIRRGIKVALPFLLATLCLRALSTADRYLIEWFDGVEVLAAYVLFTGIASAVMSFMDASVFSFQYPKLLAAANQQDPNRFRLEMKRLWNNTLIGTVLLTLTAYLLAQPLVQWLDRPVYSEHLGLLPWTLLAVALTSFSMVPHYALYARHRDRFIVFSHLAALPVFLAGVWLFRSTLGESTVAAAVAASFAFLLLFKLVAYLQTRPQA
ncbi:MAG: oligosaccharide flippase family protein [Burkholderiaceae bacterium]|nr:oligosaccharide flippase family protein [Burkholderiaceae bacterium]